MYAVICPDYTKTFPTRDAAERWLAQVIKFGACRHEHTITETAEVAS